MRNLKYLGEILLLIIIFCSFMNGAVTVTPKQIFFDQTQRMIPVTVRNQDEAEIEIAVRIVYSYITTNDTGKIDLIVDSASTELTSAAQWIKPYPTRFVLGGLESQTIRLLATPPPDLPDGEYWARIMVRVIPRRVLTDTTKLKVKGGMMMAQELGLPIYYRKGKVHTGLEANNFTVSKMDSALIYSVNLFRTGNAAFNGSRTLRLKDREGNVVRSSMTTLVVFNTFVLKDRLKIKDLPAGRYTAEFEIVPKRRDILSKYLLSTMPIRFSSEVEIF
ncbi:MAG: hypothetical protein HZB59_07120 [Ignavibacteriales bacterium]|nr:hypothetical protein [Ignavibacteriales bacterium]